MDWNEAIALLHGANWKHTKIGLERMRDFMHALGDPQEKLRYVHIAGTNGKDSDGGGLPYRSLYLAAPRPV